MYWMITLMSLSLLALIATGIYLEINPPSGREQSVRRWKEQASPWVPWAPPPWR